MTKYCQIPKLVGRELGRWRVFLRGYHRPEIYSVDLYYPDELAVCVQFSHRQAQRYHPRMERQAYRLRRSIWLSVCRLGAQVLNASRLVYSSIRQRVCVMGQKLGFSLAKNSI